MKSRYYFFIAIFMIVIFRTPFLKLTQNISKMIINKNDNLEITLIKRQNDKLKNEYNKLLDFKNKIVIDENYTITNVNLNNYGFDKLIINGKFKVGSEVVDENGLIGIISNSDDIKSDVKYLNNTNIPIKIGNINGKITGSNKDNNLIIGDLSNYDLININDKVFSINDTYIGKVLNIIKDDYQNKVEVSYNKPLNSTYVGVIER